MSICAEFSVFEGKLSLICESKIQGEGKMRLNCRKAMLAVD
jgi:hypothetical protein